MKNEEWKLYIKLNYISPLLVAAPLQPPLYIVEQPIELDHYYVGEKQRKNH